MKAPLLFIFTFALAAGTIHAVDPDLARLQKSYDEASRRALQPIQATYQAELQKLLEQHTKNGKLEAAIEVKGEIQRLSEQSNPPSVSEQMDEAALRKKLLKGRFILFFAPPRSKLMTFGGSGRIDEGGAVQEHKWKLVGNELQIYNEPGQLAYTLAYDAATDSFKQNGTACLWMSRKAYLQNAPK